MPTGTELEYLLERIGEVRNSQGEFDKIQQYLWFDLIPYLFVSSKENFPKEQRVLMKSRQAGS